MPLWHIHHARPIEKTVAPGTPLLAALLDAAATAVAAAATTAAAATAPSAGTSLTPAASPGLAVACRVAADGARTCHRAAAHALAAGLPLSSVDWPPLCGSLFSLARVIGDSDQRARTPEAAAAAPPLLALLNLLIGRGAEVGIPEGGMLQLAAGMAAAQPALSRLIRVARGVSAPSPIAKV
jgi:hypothetical protein